MFLLILVIILIKNFQKGATDKNFSEQMALGFSAECYDITDINRFHCLETKIISYISSFPMETGNVFETFWKLAKSGKLSDDPRFFSDIAHEAGMALADSDISLDKALVFCGTTFKYGCVHGAVMEYIDDKYNSKIEASKLFDLCRTISSANNIYINCLHGVGHELFTKKTPVQTILDQCNPLTSEERFACASGVMMEYSKGTAGSGMLSNMSIGKKELPCSELEDKYKSVCYASAGSYRQYQPAQEDFSKSYNFCFSSPKEYIDDCLTGLSERAILASAENQDKLNAICGQIESEDIKSSCISSIQKLTKNSSLYKF